MLQNSAVLGCLKQWGSPAKEVHPSGYKNIALPLVYPFKPKSTDPGRHCDQRQVTRRSGSNWWGPVCGQPWRSRGRRLRRPAACCGFGGRIRDRREKNDFKRPLQGLVGNCPHVPLHTNQEMCWCRGQNREQQPPADEPVATHISTGEGTTRRKPDPTPDLYGHLKLLWWQTVAQARSWDSKFKTICIGHVLNVFAFCDVFSYNLTCLKRILRNVSSNIIKSLFPVTIEIHILK